MSLSKEAIVTKWLDCKYSVEWGFTGEDGHALADEGFRQHYGCEHPNVIANDNFAKGSFGENGKTVVVAEFHSLGKDEDKSVIEALSKACSNCPFFEKR